MIERSEAGPSVTVTPTATERLSRLAAEVMAQPARPDTPHQVEVHRGDSLWTIARTALGQHASNREILHLVNEMTRENFHGNRNQTIHAGQHILIPDLPQLRTGTGAPRPTESAQSPPAHKPNTEDTARPGTDATPTRPVCQPVESNSLEQEQQRLLEVSKPPRIDDKWGDHTNFERDRREFEERARRNNIPASEVARTYREVSRLLEAKGNSPLSAEQRARLACQIMHNAAHPEQIVQGGHNSCSTTSVEVRTYARTPSEAARLVTDVALTGQYTDATGRTVRIDATPHGESQWADADSDRTGQRTHASEIFQVTAANVYWAHQNERSRPPRQVRYEQREVTEEERARGDTGERLVDYSDPTHPRVLTGRDGKPLQEPLIEDGGVADLNRWIGGRDERNVLLARYGETTARTGTAEVIRNIDDLERILELAQRNGGFPVTVRVHTGNEPFYSESGARAAGKPGDYHFISIMGYLPGPPPRVLVNTEWGRGTRHTEVNALSMTQIWNSMRAPLTIGKDIGDEYRAFARASRNR